MHMCVSWVCVYMYMLQVQQKMAPKDHKLLQDHMYIHLFICIYIYICTCIHRPKIICIYIYSYAYTYTYVHVYTDPRYTHTCIYI